MLDKRVLEEINTVPLARSKKEARYITLRKLKAFGNRICFYICRIFPIDNRLVSICNFEGKGGFGCNAKYIVSELHQQNPDIRFVWFVNKDIMEKKEFPDYIKKVPNTLWSRAYWLTRSKIWIDNYRKPYGTIKRKKQYYLNTNHYTLGIKSVGLWRKGGFSPMAYLVSKNDSDMIDDLIIDSKFGEEMCPKGLLYTGSYIKSGAPRCDVLYGNREKVRNKVRQMLRLPMDTKIVMYAPTFREGAKNGVRSVFANDVTMDFKKLVNALGKRFGGEWCVCLRLHPQLAARADEYLQKLSGLNFIDVTQYDDMYEILAGTDVYITDYSSACFEAGFARIPVFIYADDISQYVHDRGSMFWDIKEQNLNHISINREIFSELDVEFPFSIVTNNDDLCSTIQEFDYKHYVEKLDDFDRTIGLEFTGKASRNVAAIISEKLER